MRHCQREVYKRQGPGDPLANPGRTFETFRQLAERAPDIKLCVSTNGLNLPQYADEIARYNIDHVTITINCLDPEIGARISPWIFWENRPLRGVEGARILIEQQQKGLEMLTARGILVKMCIRDRAKAARILGMTPRQIAYRIQTLNIEVKQF